MDLPKRVLPQGSPGGNPKAMRRRDVEADENGRAWNPSPRRPVVATDASPQAKKIFGERNGGGGASDAATPPPPPPPPKEKLFSAASPPSLSTRGEGPYDPKTNYTTPRPDFLRYDPEKRREILLRLQRERETEEEFASTTSAAADSPSVSSGSSAPDSDSECDVADEEEVEVQAHRGGWARRLILLLVAVACLCCYVWCVNPSPFPASEMGINFLGPNVSMYDDVIHQVDYLGYLGGPIETMGSNDEEEPNFLEEAADRIVHWDSDDLVLYDPKNSPRSFMATAAVMGFADVCPNVPFGQFTCQIGDKSIENVQQLKEDYQLSEHKLDAIIGSLENAEEIREVGLLGGNSIGDSVGSTKAADMEEAESVSAHQEEGQDYSNISLQLASSEKVLEPESEELGEDYTNDSPRLVSMEKVLEPESEELDDVMDLENDKLDQGTVPEYENTAEAAKTIYANAKSLWSSMEPHLMEMLGCLSVAGFLVVLLMYFQTSPEIAHANLKFPVQSALPKQDSSASLKVSALSPMLKPEPKQDSFVSLKVSALSPMLKPEPFAFKVPTAKQIDYENCPKKIQRVDADNAKASDTVGNREIGSFKSPVVKLLGEDAHNAKTSDTVENREIGSFKSPVAKLLGEDAHNAKTSDTVENREIGSFTPVAKLLGEFSLVDASPRGRSMKDLNGHGGDVTAQELSVSLRKDVVKMQEKSSTIKDSARKTIKEKSSAKVEMMDPTPTPRRRSSRLLNRSTSP